MMTDNVPPELPPHRQHQLLSRLLGNEGFKEWFLPELQRKARALELELCGDLDEKATAGKRGQVALLRELFGMAAGREVALRQQADKAAAPAVRSPGLD